MEPETIDVPPAQRAAYEARGYVALGESALWERRAPAPAGSPARSKEYAIYPVSPAEIMELLACDRARHGASRGPLLAHLMAEHPHQSFVAVHRGTGAFSGHVFRSGDRIGPLVADGADAAAWLLHAAESAGMPARALVAGWHPGAAQVFSAAGYAPAGEARVRMTRGGAKGRPETWYALASWDDAHGLP